MKNKMLAFFVVLILGSVLLCSCMHEHQLGQWRISKEATCENSGLQVRSCAGCEYQESASIAPTGHRETVIKATAATCTVPGSTEGIKCADCGKTIKASTTIAAKGHSEDANGRCTKCGADVMLETIRKNLDVKLIVEKPGSSMNLRVGVDFINNTKYTMTLSEGSGDYSFSAKANGKVLTPEAAAVLYPNQTKKLKYYSYWYKLFSPESGDYFYCDNQSTAFVKLRIDGKTFYIKFDTSGVIAVGTSYQSVDWD